MTHKVLLVLLKLWQNNDTTRQKEKDTDVLPLEHQEEFFTWESQVTQIGKYEFLRHPSYDWIDPKADLLVFTDSPK